MLHDVKSATYRGDYKIELEVDVAPETLYAETTGQGLPKWMEPGQTTSQPLR